MKIIEKVFDFAVGYLGGKALDGYSAVKYIDGTPYVRVTFILYNIVLLYMILCFSSVFSNIQYMERIVNTVRGEPRIVSSKPQAISSETSRYELKVTIDKPCTKAVYTYSGPGQGTFVVCTSMDDLEAEPHSSKPPESFRLTITENVTQ